MSDTIPESYRDLFERPVVVALVTIMPDTQPQATPVWCSYDGTHIWINTAKGRQKYKNMLERPKATVLAIDPENPYRFCEVRCAVLEINEEQGLEHINSLSEAYTGEPDYYKYNPGNKGKETRVVFKLSPTHVVSAG